MCTLYILCIYRYIYSSVPNCGTCMFIFFGKFCPPVCTFLDCMFINFLKCSHCMSIPYCTTIRDTRVYSSALPIVNWKFHKIVHSGEFQIQLSVTQLELNSFSLSHFCTFFNFPTWLCVWSSSNAKKITKVLSSRIYVTSFTLWFFMKMCEGHRVWCTYFSPLFRNS